MKQTIAKIATVVALVGGSYFTGLNQRASYEELPVAVQEAVVLEHQKADSSIDRAVVLFKQGNPSDAYDAFEAVKTHSQQIKKIDPQYESLEDKIFQYGAAIIDTDNVVSKHIDSMYEYIVTGTPERIAEYITIGYPLSWYDEQLETINPKSGAFYRLRPDTVAQDALLKYYVNTSRRWYDAQEQMLNTLKSATDQTDQIEWATKILEKRMPNIERDRDWTDNFEQERFGNNNNK
jgi:hypothetical protein